MSVKPIRLLDGCLERAAHFWPDKTAVRAGHNAVTFAELERRASRLAASLQGAGLLRGERVAVYTENTIECAISIFAVLKAGGVFVLVNPQTKSDKLRFLLDDCGVRCLITDGHLAPVVNTVISGDVASLTHVISSGEAVATQLQPGQRIGLVPFDDALAETGSLRSPGTIPLDLAALIYTSGSTGHPKGVMQTHESMVFALESLIEYLRLESHDVIVNVLPLSFDYGLYQLLMSVRLGATLILERSFTYPAVVLKHIDERGVTVFPGVPTVFSILRATHLRQPLAFPTVRRVTNTAATLPQEYLPTLREIFPNALLFSMYGLTECKRVSYLEPELVGEKPTSVGRAIPGTEVFLRSPDGSPTPAGDVGILHVRGRHVMRGYWNRPEETDEVLRDGPLPGEKILCTGDWFRMDEDGCLYFVGRSDDIIKSRGEKVSPVEVENALYRVASVQEAAVVGVADEVLGEAVRAYIVLADEAAKDERGIRRALMGLLEGYMMPRDIVFMDSLPKSPNGKIARDRLP